MTKTEFATSIEVGDIETSANFARARKPNRLWSQELTRPRSA
jgi:hypothetical protein